jgi:hypothetical protein
MSNQSTKLYQDKNTELSTYIDKLSNVEQQLIEQISSTKDQKEQARLSNNLVLIQDTRTNLMNALSSINAYYSQNWNNKRMLSRLWTKKWNRRRSV